MIREAEARDLPQFVELAKKLRNELETYSNCPIDRQSVVHTFGQCVSSAMNLALVAEHDGQVTGALLAITQELWWSRAKEATDAMVYSQHPGDGIRLIRRYVDWAWSKPRVQVVTLAHSSGGDLNKVERFHRRLGFEPIGLISQKVRKVARQAFEAA